ncbi:MAG: hypothetical protein RLZZ175_2728 [Bacteroidota bacterium]|jgi:hypothetical protein
MYFSKTFSLIIIAIMAFSCSQNLGHETKFPSEKYKLTIDSENDKIHFDTITPLSFLKKHSVNKHENNFNFFNFNYEALKTSFTDSNTVNVYANDLTFSIALEKFDTEKFKQNISTNKDYYNKQAKYFWGIDETHLDNETVYLPKNEIKHIKIIRPNGEEYVVDKKIYQFLFELDIKSAKGYLTENNEIIIKINGGLGSGSYVVILIFNSKGKFKHKLVEALAP